MEHLVSKDAASDEPDYSIELLNTITFTEHAGKTRVEVRSQVLRASVLTDGIAAGWEECMERLAAFLTTKGVLE